MARVALVTGGTRGIGHAVVARLKADGFKVAAGYANDQATALATAKEFDAMIAKEIVSNIKFAKAAELKFN